MSNELDILDREARRNNLKAITGIGLCIASWMVAYTAVLDQGAMEGIVTDPVLENLGTSYDGITDSLQEFKSSLQQITD